MTKSGGEDRLFSINGLITAKGMEGNMQEIPSKKLMIYGGILAVLVVVMMVCLVMVGTGKLGGGTDSQKGNGTGQTPPSGQLQGTAETEKKAGTETETETGTRADETETQSAPESQETGETETESGDAGTTPVFNGIGL